MSLFGLPEHPGGITRGGKHLSAGRRHGAFTLVELSVVLVIIGLLVGGLVVGEGLLQAATLRGIARDAENYSKAVALFKERFQELPGDYSSATAQWGTDPRGCPKAYYAGERPIGTCNGNGNGVIDSAAGSGSEERWRGWQHLYNAGLIEVTLAGGIGPASNRRAELGYNVPIASKSNTGFSLTETVQPNMPASPPQVQILYGSIKESFATEAETELTEGGALIPEDARSIDQKMDDGNPFSGNVQSATAAAASGCQYTSASGMNLYNVTLTDELCALNFATGVR